MTMVQKDLASFVDFLCTSIAAVRALAGVRVIDVTLLDQLMATKSDGMGVTLKMPLERPWSYHSKLHGNDL